MSSSNENASAPRAVSTQPGVEHATAVQGSQASIASTGASQKEAKSVDAMSDEMLDALEDLYTLSSEGKNTAKDLLYGWSKHGDCPDKHDIHAMMRCLKEVHKQVVKVCDLAQKSNPTLELVEGPEYLELTKKDRKEADEKYDRQ